MGTRFDREELLGRLDRPDERERRGRALDALEAALDAVEPRAATVRALRSLELAEPVTVFAFGKAAVPMSRGALEAARVRGGIAVVLELAELSPLEVRRGAHPVPAPDAEVTGRAVLEAAEALGAGEVALCLVSGGGSAMLELPREGVPLDALRACTARLLRAGAAIDELNAVRRKLSRIKGGGLARAIHPARVVNLVISDVPGHGPEVVASGPTCPPPDHGPDALEVLRRLDALDTLGEPVRRWLEATEPPFDVSVRTVVAADNARAREGTGLPDRGLLLRGEAREVGARLAAEARGGPWVTGGETTVEVRGGGRGGRSLEVALGALAAGWDRGLLLAAGTDGIDGNSDLAGALVDPALAREAERHGLDPARFLAENDAATFFERAGGALRCGPTGTNVADLCLALP